MQKRKICFPVMSRAYYGRRKILLEALNNHANLELQLILGGPILLEKYSDKIVDEIENGNKFKIYAKLYNTIDGGNHIAAAKSACLIALEFINELYKLDPEMIIVEGDRYEQLPIAMAAAYLNKLVIHIEGGDRSGNIDESIRHAITKLSHIHFVTNEKSRERVVKMGENPKYVFNIGSLDLECLSKNKSQIDNSFLNSHGVGDRIDTDKDFLMVIYHPVTSESNNRENIDRLFQALLNIGLPVVWFWPNNDSGTNEIAKAIRNFREKNENNKTGKFRFIINLPQENFIGLLKKTRCLVGNSSSGIKECSYLGIPVVNIGIRQLGRLRGKNVIDVGTDIEKISNAIKLQLRHRPYKSSNLYYKPNPAENFVNIVSKIKVSKQKQFYE